MGNSAPKVVYNPDGSLTEVYILLKKLGEDSYTYDDDISHHVCLLKEPNGKFYCTELSSDDGEHGKSGWSGKGQIKIRFGEYQFYTKRPIYYLRVGCTRKTLAEIEQFAKKSPFNNTDYHLFLQNCQHYVRSCIKFLTIEEPVPDPGKYAGRQTSGDKMYDALSANHPSDIRLNE